MPDLSQEDYAALREDIKNRGVLVPVEYDEDGNVLDGYHRIKICEELGVTEWPKFIRKGLSEEEKYTHARQLNLARRHLNQGQRRVLIEDQLRETPGMSNRSIAKGLGVNHETVGVARDKLESTGEIRQLDKTIGADGKSRPAKPIRTLFVDDTEQGRKEALVRAKSIYAEKSETSRVERIKNIDEISRGNQPLITDRKYPIILADPPWKYENPRMGKGNRSTENHYPTMDLEEICSLAVSDIACEDSILYLWATAPNLQECMKVIDAWGFSYRTCFVWVKDKIGMGFHARNQHELLLVAKRGDIPPPPVQARVSSVIEAPRGEHSTKPEYFYELIESMYPELAKIELFCRQPHENWAVWGNQSASR